ncbi:NADH-quinone oxidoreductase subunit NuoE [Allobranchiibius sp. GilTou73]|uniref:NADH-quinone oxidoreductase subunit NuoE n=1 Tax=Allobranchiibius sp. GilTou73 TaxID=2904523 RepID=UPI001F3785F5|nr:NADH-quinone oxidoreductase subunit NuoE [Allobranchiibius sp. GilTou73]UIJ36038.1 NADH-quinone oxidoreductase subunit NuoE [Allobranchiibius sp. GilTou73]
MTDAHVEAPFHELTPLHASETPYDEETLRALHADADLVVARYPQKRSALLPLLHLIQSVDGYVTGRGVTFCAEKLELTDAEVSGVATFYTQYKRHPNGEYTVGVCTNTLCAVMGGDLIFDTLSEHLGIGHDETTPDGKVTLERVECNAACDYAPVVMANWEFIDNQTPTSATQLVDDLRAGKEVRPTRGASKVCSFKHVSRVLAGFNDGLADEGVGAGGPSLEGLRLAKADGFDPYASSGEITSDSDAESPADAPAPGLAGSSDTPANPADSKAGEKAGDR